MRIPRGVVPALVAVTLTAVRVRPYALRSRPAATSTPCVTSGRLYRIASPESPVMLPSASCTIKSAAVLSYLEARHDVEVVCFRGHDEEPWVREGGVISIPLQRGRSVRHLVSSYAGGVPLSIERNRNEAMAERVAQLLETGAHDAVFVDSWLMAQYVPDEYRGIRLLHEHNAEHVMWRRHAELETNPIRRPLVRLEARRVRRYEAGLLSRFDVVFAVSERDRATLAALVTSGPRIELLPNVARSP